MFFTESTGFQESGKYNYIVIDEHTDLTQLAEDSILEAEEYTSRLMEGIGRFELAKISEGVAPAEIYTEGMVGAIWEKIKKIFKFAKEWIKVIFRKFMAWVNSIIKSDADFATKYKKDIEKGFALVDRDKEISVKFNLDAIKGDDSKIESYAEHLRASAVSALGEYVKVEDGSLKSKENKADATKEDLEKFRDDLDEKVEEFRDEFFGSDTMKISDFQSANNIIELLKGKLSNITKAEKTVVGELDRVEKQYTGNKTNPTPNVVAAINAFIGFIKKMTTEVLKAARLLKSAARKAARVCISVANKGPKWSEYRESAFDRTELNDYLRNV
jgi:hypothetical protein|uniref:Uncharacterized protein n=1 Tax=Myoviridae sp. ctYA416 TaxID=2825125 RepID=A0A8S5UTR9_9CAUD|nr:MAG TPA: hypothetical protein [Myoviridae sp. ctYA416]